MTMTSSVSIQQVEVPQRRPAGILDMSVDRPVAGSSWSGPSLEISGWVLGRSSPATSLEIRHDGRLLRKIPVCRRRLKVARRFPDTPGAESSGFVGIVSTLGLPRDLELELVVGLEDGSRQRIAMLRGRRSPIRSAFEPTLQPLMVTTLGRMASTWIMSLLAAHPQIVALRKYPYECKTAKYWTQVLAGLAEPTMQPRDKETVHADRWWVGANPFFEPDLIREPRPGAGLFSDRMAEACQRNIDSWYTELAFHQVKENVCYFAEKMTPGRLPYMMRELYPNAREVFLVRDFRDWICSILAFDAKRGFHGFGRGETEPTADYVRRHGRYAFQLRRHWQTRRGTAHLVRYEDLVDRPGETLRALFEYLEVDSTAACVAAALTEAKTESETYRHHRTSASARDSIGRWRTDLEPELRDLVQELFSDVLPTFGYADPEAEPAFAEAAAPTGSATYGLEGQSGS